MLLHTESLPGKRKNTFCKAPIYITLRVRVFHVTTGIRRWQHWPFCHNHFREFMTRQGQGYTYIKQKDASLLAVVIEYETPEGDTVKVESHEVMKE